jgi:hypothetical protein
MLCD